MRHIDDPAPERQISEEGVPVDDLTGYLLPCAPQSGGLIVLPIVRDGDPFVFLFTTKELLDAAMERFGLPDWRVRQVGDHAEFVQDLLAANVRVALDLRPGSGGTDSYRFTELVLG